MAADLHVHSIFSDGSKTPEELVKIAEEKGLKTIALADHDTVKGIERGINFGKARGMEVIPAIELSTSWNEAEIHLLGYFIDYKNPVLLREINKYYTARLERARKMVQKLNNLGIMISYNDVQRLAGDKFVGRPHIARAMKEAGYIKDVAEAFTPEFIGNRGQAYVPKHRLRPEEGISLILQAGGIPVIAHPYLINKDAPFGKVEIVGLMESGLAGIEVYHSKQPPAVSEYYYRIAEELGLLITGGSDYHGENTPGIELGDICIEEELVARLRARAASRTN